MKINFTKLLKKFKGLNNNNNNNNTFLFYFILFILFIFSTYFILKSFNFSFDFNFNNDDIIISLNENENGNESENISINENEIVEDKNFETAYVKRIVDGDTIVVTINKKDYKVRLIGINTPESTTKIEYYGKEASNYTTSILLNTTVYLEKDVSNTDKYGRLLRYVWMNIPSNIDDENIQKNLFNAQLLLEGYAKLATYPPDVKYVDYLKNYQEISRKENKGLWKN